MPDIQTLILLFLSGCLGGFFAGLLGVGGGMVFIPVLAWYFTREGLTDPDLTRAFLANSFFAIIFSGLSASVRLYRMDRFYPRPVLLTSLGAVASSLLVSWLIGQGQWYDKKTFAISFIIVLIFLNIRLYINREKETALNADSFPNFKFIFIGLITGAFAALSGLGGGFVMVMLFVQWLEIDIKQSTSISNGAIPLISIPLVIYYMIQQPLNFPPQLFHIGYIALYTMLPIIAGVVLFSPLGVKTAARLQPKTIKMIFIFVSLMIIIKMLLQFT